jgi:predicted RNase H-like nuclease
VKDNNDLGRGRHKFEALVIRSRNDLPMGATTIIGFDSAWTDKPTAPGAVCAIQLKGNGQTEFVEPQLASFREALGFIRRQRSESKLCLVALDQPTIVPNETSCRPVDRVAGSLISWLGGGVQPANRSKIGMFDHDAPIWKFKSELDAGDDPERARSASSGLFLIEVFPALALPTLEAAYFGCKLGPRYNPDRRETFQLGHWCGVLAAVARLGSVEKITGIAHWVEKASELERPRKSDQDKLDAVICALVGYQWLSRPRTESIMIGDLSTGYMIAPASPNVRARLTSAAIARGVQVDGKLPI